MKIISISNQKGGVLKTNLSFQYTLYLAQVVGLKVGAIDLDPQGDLSKFITRRAEFDESVRILNTFSSFISASDESDLAIEKTEHKISLFPGDLLLSGLEKYSVVEVLDAVSLIRDFEDTFDVLVIDTPPTVGNVVLAGVGVADYLIIPHSFDSSSEDGVNNIIADTQMLNTKKDNQTKLLAIVPTCIDGSDQEQIKMVVSALKSDYGKYLAPPIRSRRVARQAMNAAQATWELKTRSAGKKEILTCLEWITKKWLPKGAKK